MGLEIHPGPSEFASSVFSIRGPFGGPLGGGVMGLVAPHVGALGGAPKMVILIKHPLSIINYDTYIRAIVSVINMKGDTGNYESQHTP